LELWLSFFPLIRTAVLPLCPETSALSAAAFAFFFIAPPLNVRRVTPLIASAPFFFYVLPFCEQSHAALSRARPKRQTTHSSFPYCLHELGAIQQGRTFLVDIDLFHLPMESGRTLEVAAVRRLQIACVSETADEKLLHSFGPPFLRRAHSIRLKATPF